MRHIFLVVNLGMLEWPIDFKLPGSIPLAVKYLLESEVTQYWKVRMAILNMLIFLHFYMLFYMIWYSITFAATLYLSILC